MFSRRLASTFGISLFTAFLLLCLISGIIGMFCWPIGINMWLSYTGQDPSFKMYQGFIMGLIPFFGKFSVLFIVITWIAMAFLT